MQKRKVFSTDEDRFLKDNLEKLTNKELAAKLGRSKSSVVNRLVKLNLRRSAETRIKRRKIGQFKKGHIPWTKGLKGMHFSPETEFKKGNVPATAKFDGCISLRKHSPTDSWYFWIRIKQGCWIMYQQYLWERRNGPLPEGKFLRSVDGNTLNVDLNNWILVDRRENLDLNRNPEKAGESLKKAWDADQHLESDKFIAFTLAPNNEELRKEFLNHKDLIELQRNSLKLRREIKRHEQNADK